MAILTVQNSLQEGIVLKVSAGNGGTFLKGEGLSFAPSGAAGVFEDLSPASLLRLFPVAGLPAATDTVTGERSGATRVIDSFDDEILPFVQPSAAGDEFENDERTLFVINNQVGARITARFVGQRPSDQRRTNDMIKVVGTGGTSFFGTFQRWRFNNPSGRILVELSNTGPLVGIAALRMRGA